MNLPDSTHARGFAGYSALLLVLVGAIAVLLFSTLKHGNEWDGNSALYIMNARNIVLGLPYSHTPYVLNADNLINPASYPPGLPLLIAPVYRVFGVDLFKMKLVCLSAYVIFLFVYARIARGFLSSGFALAATAAVGLHPYIWDMTNTLGSELPFMLFCYSAMLLLSCVETYGVVAKLSATRYWIAAFAACMVALAYLTRSIGIILFPAAYFASVLRSRRLANMTGVTLAAAAALVIAVQHHFPADTGTYLNYIRDFSPTSPIDAGVRYFDAFSRHFIGWQALPIFWTGRFLCLVVIALAALGVARRLRLQGSVYEAFLLAYVAFLLFYPVTLEPDRYSMPVWPMLVLYFCVGLQHVAESLKPIGKYALEVLSCCVLVILYAARYHNMDYGPVPYSMDAKPSIELFSSIKGEVPANAGVLARKPTIIALYTDRRSAIWPEHFTDDELWSYLASAGIQYIVQDYAHLGVRPQTPDPLDDFVQHNASQLQGVFKNEWFALYRIDRQRSPGR